MKKTLLIAAFLPLFFVGCGGSDVTDNGENGELVDTVNYDFSGMESVSLNEYGLNLSLMLPSMSSPTGGSIEPLIVHDEGDYLWYLSIGQRFKLVIEDYGKEMDKIQGEKERLSKLGDIFEVEYTIDEPNLFMYQRTLHEGQGGKKSYHCYGQVVIGGYNYVLRSNDEGSLKPIITDMVKTIRSAKES